MAAQESGTRILLNGPAKHLVPVSKQEPAEHPFPFDDCYDRKKSDDLPAETLPNLTEDHESDLSAVLKGLAQGRYPRQNAVPLALNAYNFDQACWRDVGNHQGDNRARDKTRDERKAWAYFHPITDIPCTRVQPGLDVPDRIVNDLDFPWPPLWPTTAASKSKAGEESGNRPIASYRFLCFIHRHKIYLKHPERSFIVMPKRSPHYRTERQEAVETFWHGPLRIPGCRFHHGGPFRDGIKYRMSYEMCNELEYTIRNLVAPRYTLWSVVGISLYCMNHAKNIRDVSVIPDRLELFSGHSQELLPRLYVQLLFVLLGDHRRKNGYDKEGDGEFGRRRANGLGTINEPEHEGDEDGEGEEEDSEEEGEDGAQREDEDEDEDEDDEEQAGEGEAHNTSDLIDPAAKEAEFREDQKELLQAFKVSQRLTWMKRCVRKHLDDRRKRGYKDIEWLWEVLGVSES